MVTFPGGINKVLCSLQVGRAVRLIAAGAPGSLWISGLLWVANCAWPLVSLFLLKCLVDDVAAIHAGNSSPGHTLLLVGLLGGAALLGSWCLTLAALVDESQAQQVTDYVADVLHAKSIELDLEYYDQARYYGMLYRAQQEAPYRPFRMVKGLGRVVQNGLGLVALAGVLLSFHWLLMVLVFASALPGFWVRLRHARALHTWQQSRTEAERRAGYYQGLLIEEAFAKEIRLFDLGGLFRDWFRNLRRRLRREKLGLAKRRCLADVAAQSLSLLAIFGALAYFALAVRQGEQTPGDFVLFYLAVKQAFGYFSELISGLSGLYEDRLFLANFYEFLELRPRVADPAVPRPVPASVREGFVFDRVSFAYPGSPRPALEGVSLAVRPGQVVALVGDNGAGKSTVVKLLCRLYDPTSGRITLDGVPLDRFALAPLRRLMSGVFQDFVRYSLTLGENVWLGDVGLPPPAEELAAALGLTGADRVAGRLPKGPETLLGHWQEEGLELSGGEWQKVALARALVRQSPLLVLDEPTSNMDPQAETRFFERLRPTLGGRAVLMVSHRFSTIRQADMIYVLAGGRVVHQGTHQELVQREGWYATNWKCQMGNGK
jgi:ATP-binding cassette subfamily B protein